MIGERRLALYALIWMEVCLYFAAVVDVTNDKRISKHPIKDEPLPDIGFDIFPDLEHSMPWLANVLTGLFLVTVAVRVGLDNSLSRAKILKRTAFLNGCIFILRSFCIVSTNLPNPFGECRKIVWGNPFLEGLKILTFQRETCSDVFFSGHTVNITLGLMITEEYIFRPKSALTGADVCQRIWFWTIASACYCGIIATHFHYTIDVEIGLTLVLLTWRWYHSIIHNPLYIVRSSFLHWFEPKVDKDVRAVIEAGIERLRMLEGHSGFSAAVSHCGDELSLHTMKESTTTRSSPRGKSSTEYFKLHTPEEESSTSIEPPEHRLDRVLTDSDVQPTLNQLPIIKEPTRV